MFLKFKIYLIALIALSSKPSFADPIQIEARIANGNWKAKNSIESVKGLEVSLRVKPVKGATIRWYEIIPDISVRYNNAVWPWLPNAYKWKGFDEIKYDRLHLGHFDGKWQIDLHSKCTDDQEGISSKSDSIFSYLKRRFIPSSTLKSSFRNSKLGSFWYQAEVTHNNHILMTPGIGHKDKRGLSPNVFRVSIKKDDDLLGDLTSFFNVPAVFGSTPYQVRNYIGIDCADVLMAAYCKSKRWTIKKDYNVAMLTTKFKTVLKTNIQDGQPASEIQWESDVREGDFIAVKYSSSKQYQHIGALYNDKNGNGLLDKEDLVLHAGPDPLHWSELRTGKFDGTVLILRPD